MSELPQANITELENFAKDIGVDIKDFPSITTQTVEAYINTANQSVQHLHSAMFKPPFNIPQEYITTKPIDAIKAALVARRILGTDGGNYIDLGSGDGAALFGFAFANFGSLTGVELSTRLWVASNNNWDAISSSWPEGVDLPKVNFINTKFSGELAKNPEEVRDAMLNSNVMFTYPFKWDIENRLNLFNSIAKNGALLAMLIEEPEFLDFHINPNEPSIGERLIEDRKIEIVEPEDYGIEPSYNNSFQINRKRSLLVFRKTDNN